MLNTESKNISKKMHHHIFKASRKQHGTSLYKLFTEPFVNAQLWISTEICYATLSFPTLLVLIQQSTWCYLCHAIDEQLRTIYQLESIYIDWLNLCIFMGFEAYPMDADALRFFFIHFQTGLLRRNYRLPILFPLHGHYLSVLQT